jgi:hypothetical protein
MVAVGGGALLALTRLLPSTDPLFSFPGIVPEIIALIVAVPLLLLSTQVVTARDARRFAVGFVGIVGVWFAFLYPNISALPLPSTLVNAYQGLLPTYLYAFQFPVSTAERNVSTPLLSPTLGILAVAITVSCLVVAYSAWLWRIALAESAASTASSGPEVGGEAADSLARTGGGA